MSDASVVFLPWIRQGLAARIAVSDPVTTPLAPGAPLGVSLAVNGVDAASMPVRLHGPADVVGIDPRQVVRTEPPAGTPDYESNDLAAVEFDNPDLPWLFTPAAADPQGRLRPWLVLVVVRRQEGVRLRPPRNEPLPALEIGPPAVPSAELPDLADSWAWAHAQVSTREGASEADLRGLLAGRPELSVGRLLCPRLLTPFTDYLACVVPAFEPGRRAGLGDTVDASAMLTPAWLGGAPTVTLPVYYHWEFRTGAREDFESMVARLAPRDLSNAVGRRPMDISQPGFSVPAMPAATVLLEGALQPVGAPRAIWPPDTATTTWQQKLQSILNAANARAAAAEAEPVVGPPIYGRWYAGRHELGMVSPPSWLDQLNLDPRERVVAALGTRVIQQQQEELMASAWEQSGELARVNQRLRQMQLSLAINRGLYTRHVERMNDDDALWRFAAPAQARLVMPASTPGTAPMTMSAVLAASSTPQVTVSAAMRRLSRPGGAISRRATRAVLLAGGPRSASSMTGVSAMFSLFSAQPQIIMFTLPPTRGLVSFDAVTRRLPAEFIEMNWARATDLAVAVAPPRPDFVVTGEPATVTGLTHELGTVLHARGGRTARRARRPGPDGIELPDLPEPEVEPERPHPLPPPSPTVDSADAQAFREAASRHLARVNPAPTFFAPPPPVLLRPVLDAASARALVREVLDPAPALQMRMAATIRIAGPEEPREIGPLGTSPTFTQPMSEPLAALSQDWLLPGLERVPPDTVALLEPNARFIEAFMLGLNVEMGRELLWRDFPIHDPRATYFRRFWRAVTLGGDGDIAPIAEWAQRALGSNPATAAGARQVVLLVRSALFRRYPNAVVYAVPAVPAGAGRTPGAQADERHPLFRGALQPDVSFFGFELDPTEAIRDPGWYFVIQQQPTEPRFGFDVEIDFGSATHVPLTAPPTGHAMPAGTQWARNGAHMARIIRQQPVRVAIHASELITP